MESRAVKPEDTRAFARSVYAHLRRTRGELEAKNPEDAHPLNPGRHGELITAIRVGQQLEEGVTTRKKQRVALLTSVSKGEVSVRRAIVGLQSLKRKELDPWYMFIELKKVLILPDEELIKLIPDLSQDQAIRSDQIERLRIGAAKILFSLNERSFKRLISAHLLPGLINNTDETNINWLTFLNEMKKQGLAKLIRNLSQCNSFGEGSGNIKVTRERFDKCGKLLFDLTKSRKDIDSRFILEALSGKSRSLKENSSNEEHKTIARQQRIILAVLRNFPVSDPYISTVGLNTAIEIYKTAASDEVSIEALEVMFDGFNIDRDEAIKIIRDIALDTTKDIDNPFFRTHRTRRMEALQTYLILEPFECYSKDDLSPIQLELKDLLCHERDPLIVNEICKLLSSRSLCQVAGQELLVKTICDQIEQGEPSLPLACIASMAKYKNYPDYLNVLLEVFSRDIDLVKAFYGVNDLEVFGISEDGKNHEYGTAQYSLCKADAVEIIGNLLDVLLPYIAHSMENTVPEEDVLMNNTRDLVQFALQKKLGQGMQTYQRWVYSKFGKRDDPKTFELFTRMAGTVHLMDVEDELS